MPKSWDDLKPDFDRITLQRGVAKVASEIPADRVTVYRLLKGTTAKPSIAIRAGVERIVQEDQEP